jgi:predicted GIY-YIG superfamily endonuclease
MARCPCLICKNIEDTNEYLLYSYRLKSSVLDNKKFIEANEGVVRTSNIMYYVGMTERRFEDRIKQHKSKSCKKSTKWGKLFMIRGSEELPAHFGTLDHKFGTKTGSKIAKQKYVLNKESELAAKLREQGHWVIQH